MSHIEMGISIWVCGMSMWVVLFVDQRSQIGVKGGGEN